MRDFMTSMLWSWALSWDRKALLGLGSTIAIYNCPLCEGCIGQDNVVAQANNLQMIVRAHECVMDGFERFAQGHLITLFSATNYCGTANNAGGALKPTPIASEMVLIPAG